MKISALAQMLDAQAFIGVGSPLTPGSPEDVEIRGVAPLDKAAAGTLSFIAKPEYERFAATTAAAAIIVAKALPDVRAVQLVHKNPYYAFAKIAGQFIKETHGPRGVHPKAHVAEGAQLGADVTVYPNVYIAEGAVVGARTVLYPGVFVGRGVKIGDDCVIYANAVIERGTIIGHRAIIHGGAVIGADGFGFAPSETDIAKIPQVGIVRIGDDVEIGSLSSIDRAAMGETRIASGVKIDSHVHVGHNVSIGENTMLCGMVGIAGSARIGRWNIIGGHTGVAGHIELKDHIQVGGKSGVTKSLSEKGQYLGFPAVPAREWREQTVYLRKLSELVQRVKDLEKKTSP